MKKFLFFCVIILFFGLNLKADQLPEYLPFIKDHPSSMILPKHYLELDYNYGKINDTLDILNLKQKELKNINAGDIGNYTENGGIINFSLTDDFMVTGILKKRNLDYGKGSLDVKTYGLSFRKSFNSLVSFDFGFIKNKGDDIKFIDLDEINYYAKKFDPRISIKYTPKFIIFTKKEANGNTEEIGVLRKEDLYISIENMKDYTKFYRLTLGKTYDIFYPNIFFEYGRTKITTKIDSNIRELLPDKYKNFVPGLPVKLDRHEKYYKFGCSLFIKTPLRTLTYIEYFYQKFKRGSGLNYVDYNQVFKAELNYFVRGNIILSIGGIYLHRQLNGEIPFLYNKYSQTTFDHRYGWLNFGLTYIW